LSEKIFKSTHTPLEFSAASRFTTDPRSVQTIKISPNLSEKYPLSRLNLFEIRLNGTSHRIYISFGRTTGGRHA
jgi:hypothetical protein